MPTPARGSAARRGRSAPRRAPPRPAAAGSSREMTFSVVVLPLPFGPIRPCTSPARDRQVQPVDRAHAAEGQHDAAQRDASRAVSLRSSAGSSAGRGTIAAVWLQRPAVCANRAARRCRRATSSTIAQQQRRVEEGRPGHQRRGELRQTVRITVPSSGPRIEPRPPIRMAMKNSTDRSKVKASGRDVGLQRGEQPAGDAGQRAGEQEDGDQQPRLGDARIASAATSASRIATSARPKRLCADVGGHPGARARRRPGRSSKSPRACRTAPGMPGPAGRCRRR